MSTRNKRGAWVIPADQVREFTSGEIDYDSLIADCMREIHRTDNKIKIKETKNTVKKKNKSKTVFSITF